MHFENTLSFARSMDKNDPLKKYRNRFHIPKYKGKNTIYFTGNSLGLQPKSTKKYIQQELDDWAKLGVEGHFHAKNPWMPYHEKFAKLIAGIVGAKPHEVVVMNQLTINLHLLMVSFYKPTKKRYKIICEAKAFPSDQYALQSQVRFHGLDPQKAIIEIAPRKGEHAIRHEDILKAIEKHKDSLNMVLMGGVNYYSGQVLNMKEITKAAHDAGACAGFDLAHAVGNISLELHKWNTDFACWCSYKYLNSGPGGVGGIYIHERFSKDSSLQRFAGWWGSKKETRFSMPEVFEAIPTAEGWQMSNAPILSMAAHKAALDIFHEAGFKNLIAKSKIMTGYLFFLLKEIQKKQPGLIEIITPFNEKEHGCQVSLLMLKNGRSVFNRLQNKGVISDWREPNVIRIAPVPLYNTYEDIYKFYQILMQEK
ncbi:MAG: kynureninase [Bacteroidetes bacterium]|nr:kynureninase [Bacteroidota bacterium]